MRHAELATLVALTRQLSALTKSDRVRAACLVVVKAAKARQSRHARRRGQVRPYYPSASRLVEDNDTATIWPWPAHFTVPIATSATGPHLGGGHFPPQGTPCR